MWCFRNNKSQSADVFSMLSHFFRSFLPLLPPFLPALSLTLVSSCPHSVSSPFLLNPTLSCLLSFLPQLFLAPALSCHHFFTPPLPLVLVHSGTCLSWLLTFLTSALWRVIFGWLDCSFWLCNVVWLDDPPVTEPKKIEAVLFRLGANEEAPYFLSSEIVVTDIGGNVVSCPGAASRSWNALPAGSSLTRGETKRPELCTWLLSQ